MNRTPKDVEMVESMRDRMEVICSKCGNTVSFTYKLKADMDALVLHIESSPCEQCLVDQRQKSAKSLFECFYSMRFRKDHHLGLGDIRLTIGQQNELISLIEKGEE